MQTTPSLAEVIALSRRATPGPMDYTQELHRIRQVTTFCECSDAAVITEAADSQLSAPMVDAEFIAKLVNWFRTSAASLRDEDARRLDWMAHHGAALRCDPGDANGWYIVAPYHTGIPGVDDRRRFSTPRAAIDAALDEQASGKGES